MDKKLVVLFSGKISSGKNTASDIFKEELEKYYNKNVFIDSFARPLKEMARDCFRPLTDYLNTNYLSCSPNGEWIKDENWFENKTPITRILLQQLGTEIFRNHVSENYWVDLFRKNVIQRNEMITFCSDLRFPGEIEFLESCDDINVLTIRIERNIERNNTFNEHVSETALDDYKDWDIIIRNDGTLEELRNNIRGLVTKEHTHNFPDRNIFSRYIK